MPFLKQKISIRLLFRPTDAITGDAMPTQYVALLLMQQKITHQKIIGWLRAKTDCAVGQKMCVVHVYTTRTVDFCSQSFNSAISILS